jgi:hypothetical protein
MIRYSRESRLKIKIANEFVMQIVNICITINCNSYNSLIYILFTQRIFPCCILLTL